MSDELAGALRELAVRHETPPRVDAVEIRGRAGRRSRRRRTALALGTAATTACVLTAVAFTLHPGDPAGKRHHPGAAPGTAAAGTPPAGTSAPGTPAPGVAPPVPSATSSGVLDLGRHTLTIGDRVMRVDPYSFGRYPAGTRLTVADKTEADLLPFESRSGTDGQVTVSYLVELHTPGRETVYAGGLDLETQALMRLSAEAGWVSMSVKDAEWFYHQVRVGARIELRSTATPGAGTKTPLPEHAGTAAPDR